MAAAIATTATAAATNVYINADNVYTNFDYESECRWVSLNFQ
jgi:hypothetical protein